MKVACLGAGYFSQFHLSGWRAIDGVEVVGISDLDGDAARATGLPVYPTLSDMMAHTSPDILDIIIPPEGHAEAIREGLRHAPRAIICQKPFCTSLHEAREMALLAQEAGIPLIVHENFRFQPWYRALRSLLDEGAIGTPLQATFRMRPGDGQGPDAYMARQPYFQGLPRFLVHETAVHWVDTFRYLFGNPTAVYADLRQLNPVIAGEDAGFILFDHPGGVRVMFDGNRLLDHAAENTRCTMGEGLFEGTGGSISLRGDGSLYLRAFGQQEEVCVLPPDTSGIFGGDCARHLQAHVVTALSDGGGFENTAIDYLTVLEVKELVYQSSFLNNKIEMARQ